MTITSQNNKAKPVTSDELIARAYASINASKKQGTMPPPVGAPVVAAESGAKAKEAAKQTAQAKSRQTPAIPVQTQSRVPRAVPVNSTTALPPPMGAPVMAPGQQPQRTTQYTQNRQPVSRPAPTPNQPSIGKKILNSILSWGFISGFFLFFIWILFVLD